MGKARIRIANGNPPFAIDVRTLSDVSVYSYTSNSDEVEIPDEIEASLSSGMKIYSEDIDGNTDLLEYDRATLSVISKYHVGRSVANGDINNHLEALTKGEVSGFTFAGVLFPWSDFFPTDQAFNDFENLGEFNHTVPISGTPQHPFDVVVRKAYTNATCKHLRVGLWLGRDFDKLNNGTTRTSFFNTNDVFMRPDGVTPVHRTQDVEVVPTLALPSFSSDTVLEATKRFVIAFFNRYLPAINDATIAFIGFPVVNSAETEYPLFYQQGFTVESIDGSSFSLGDFNPQTISKFKVMFPEFSGVSNTDIKNSAGGSNLKTKYDYFLSKQIARFEHAVADAVIDEVEGLTRTKWLQHDSGSFVDELAPYRKSFDINGRLHKASLLIKSNDDSNRSLNTINFILDHGSSVARKAGGIFMVEPTPQGGNFGNSVNRGYVVTEMQQAFLGGRAHMSFVTNNDTDINYLMTTSGITPGVTPDDKKEFIISGSDKILLRFNINLSTILSANTTAFNTWQPSWLGFKSANGLNMVDTLTIDDINPNQDNQCANGPTLLSILNSDKDSLQFQFDGTSISNIIWRIKASSTTVRSDNVNPTNSTPTIAYSPLTPGVYTFEIEGGNCTSGVTSLPFTVDEDPVEGDLIAKNVTKGFPGHMNIVISGEGTSKTITDTANFTPPSGYEFWYFLNDFVIKQNTRLINYPWPSDVPLGVLKGQGKLGLDTFNRWECPGGGYYDCTAGATFSYNTSFAFQNIFFEPAGVRWNPAKQVVQWMDYLPYMPDPANGEGDVWVMPKGSISTVPELQAVGVTHFSNYSVSGLPTAQREALQNAGKTYNEVPQTSSQLGLPFPDGTPNWVAAPGFPLQFPFQWNNDIFGAPSGATEPMTTAQGFAAGMSFDISHAVIVFENSEGNHAVGAQWPFWTTYYDALTGRLQTRFGNKWRVAHNYFTGAVNPYPAGSEWAAKKAAYGENPATLGFATRAQHKNFLGAPLSEWPPSNILPGGNMEKVNSACYGIYLNAPDLTRDNAYKLLYSTHLTQKANKYLFVFMQSFYEWKPNNLQETEFPEGKFYKYVKMPHNPAQATNYAFLSRTFADGFIPFSAAAKTDGNFKYDRTYWNDSLWFPTGSSSPANNDTFPYWGTPEAFATSGFEDYVARGMEKWYNSFGQTIGGTRSFLRYRINGGAWVEPQNTNLYDVVDAFFDKRAIVFAEVKDNKMAVFYLNPYADGSIKTLEYKHPTSSTTYTMEVASTIVHEKLHVF